MLRALLLLAVLAAPAAAQDRAATERRLSGLRDQIDGVERQVERTRGQERSALQALDGLEAEIQLRERLVADYRAQVGSIRSETEALRTSIESLETEIQDAKLSYRARARHAYIHGRRNSLALILAAGSVNQMIVRARYLQRFADRRRQQVARIDRKSAELRVQEAEVREALERTQRLLAQGQSEQRRLAERRQDRSALVAQLQTQRGRLERELGQRRRDARQLEGLVQELVAAERQRAAQERARREAEQARQAQLAREREAARRAETAQRRADEAAARARQGAATRTAPERRTPPAPTPTPTPETSPPVAAAPPDTPAPRAAPVEPAADRVVDLTGSFRQNRGRLPWPVDGTLTGRFGSRRDGADGTTISVPGIDITTRPGAPARAVYEGTVQRVGAIPTYGTYVLVTHGEFVTMYANLSQVVVRQGQRVRAGQVVGRSGTDRERRGPQLFFALYQGGAAVDPVGWLRGR